jgi:hypothetical protein
MAPDDKVQPPTIPVGENDLDDDQSVAKNISEVDAGLEGADPVEGMGEALDRQGQRDER